MKNFSFSTLLIASLALAIPVHTGVPNMEAVKKYLYGEPNPGWLDHVDANGSYNFFEDPIWLGTTFNWTILMSRIGFFVQRLKGIYYDANSSVKFWLYTKEEPVRRQILLEDLESTFNSSTFDPKNPIRFLIHGWQNDETSDMIQMNKDAYLKKGDFNVIVVDWGNGANTPNYYTSRHRVGAVAKVLTRFVKFMIEHFNIKEREIQLIGHSLGAHIAGFTGKAFVTNKIGVIVGLDPAFPLFNINSPNERLDKTDAEYVAVIHTATGSLGFNKPIGHADFYPNYGRSQPGCGWDVVGICAHSRAYEYFSESILSDVGFWSFKCGEYMEITKKKCQPTGAMVTLGGSHIRVMARISNHGPDLDPRAYGTFYLETYAQSPFVNTNYILSYVSSYNYTTATTVSDNTAFTLVRQINVIYLTHHFKP